LAPRPGLDSGRPGAGHSFLGRRLYRGRGHHSSPGRRPDHAVSQGRGAGMKQRRVPTASGSQRGVAIIAALLVVIAAAAMATALIERQGVLAAELTMQRDRAQAGWALRGALDWSRAVLRMDAERSATTRL